MALKRKLGRDRHRGKMVKRDTRSRPFISQGETSGTFPLRAFRRIGQDNTSDLDLQFQALGDSKFLLSTPYP